MPAEVTSSIEHTISRCCCTSQLRSTATWLMLLAISTIHSGGQIKVVAHAVVARPPWDLESDRNMCGSTST